MTEIRGQKSDNFGFLILDFRLFRDTERVAMRFALCFAIRNSNFAILVAALLFTFSSSVEALIITNNNFTFAHRRVLFNFAAMNRLPTTCGRAAFVEDGGFMSYAATREHSFRRAAVYVDKILKGAKPAELPVAQPTKFEWMIVRPGGTTPPPPSSSASIRPTACG